MTEQERALSVRLTNYGIPWSEVDQPAPDALKIMDSNNGAMLVFAHFSGRRVNLITRDVLAVAKPNAKLSVLPPAKSYSTKRATTRKRVLQAAIALNTLP